MKKKIVLPLVLAGFITVSSLSVAALLNQKPAEEPAAQAQKDTEIKASVKQEEKKQEAAEAYPVNQQLKAQYNALTKENIYHKMLNTIDFYNFVSGTLETSMLTPGENTVVDYQVDFNLRQAYERVHNNQTDAETYNLNSKLYDFDNLEKSKDIALVDSDKSLSTPIPDDERITKMEDGSPCYNNRNDPTFLTVSSLSLFPQGMTFGYLQDFNTWDIKGTQTYLGRECAVVEGGSASSYGEKLATASFRILVDAQTGIILKFEGFDQNGNVSNYVTTTSFTVSEKSLRSAVSYDLSKYEDYTSRNDNYEFYKNFSEASD